MESERVREKCAHVDLFLSFLRTVHACALCFIASGNQSVIKSLFVVQLVPWDKNFLQNQLKYCYFKGGMSGQKERMHKKTDWHFWTERSHLILLAQSRNKN